MITTMDDFLSSQREVEHLSSTYMTINALVVSRDGIRSDLDRIFQNPYPILNKINISISISIYYGFIHIHKSISYPSDFGYSPRISDLSMRH